MDIVEKLNHSYQEKFGQAPVFRAYAPGRVNLLGEHVDYNDGFVLPAAIDRATYIAFSPSDTDYSTLVALDFNQEVMFRADGLARKRQIDSGALPEWATYPAGVMWALGESKLAVPNINAVYTSNVPPGSGLSSSASIEMAFMIAWKTLGEWELSPMERALLGKKAENEFVGVNCGIMDQFASACGVEDHLLLLDCRSLEWQPVPMPKNFLIVIADTAVRRKLTSGEYNRRRFACEEAVRILQKDLPSVKSLRDVSVMQFNSLVGNFSAEIWKRARHVVEEIERSKQALALLEAGDARRFGNLMNECHLSLRDLYEVSCPELDLMVEIAQSLEGCLGARLTGAGFGGCTVNLVEKQQAAYFAEKLAGEYEARSGLHPEIYISELSKGAGLLD